MDNSMIAAKGTEVRISEHPKLFQMELVRHLARDEEFYRESSRLLRPDDMDYPPARLLYDALRSCYAIANKLPTMTTLRMKTVGFADTGGPETAPLTDEELPALQQMLDYMTDKYDDPLDLEVFRDELIMWIKNYRMNALVQNNAYDGASGMAVILENSREIQEITRIDDVEMVDGWHDVQPITDYSQVIRISTGLRGLDACSNNGLGPGELGLVVACPGVGKTTMLLHYAAAAVRQGYAVLFISCEMSAARIARRFQSMTAHISGDLMKQHINTWPVDALARWHTAREVVEDGLFTILDYSKRCHHVDEIKTALGRWEKKVANKFGNAHPPMLVCLDWLHPAYLAISNQQRQNEKEYQFMASLAKQIGMIGRNFNVALWAAAQANRGADGKSFLRMGDVAGSYDLNQPLDLNISLAPQQDLADTMDPALTYGDEDDDEGATAVSDGGRVLIASLAKTREKAPPSMHINLYQSPTLELYDNKEKWKRIERRLKQPNGYNQIKVDMGLMTVEEFM